MAARLARCILPPVSPGFSPAMVVPDGLHVLDHNGLLSWAAGSLLVGGLRDRRWTLADINASLQGFYEESGTKYRVGNLRHGNLYEGGNVRGSPGPRGVPRRHPCVGTCCPETIQQGVAAEAEQAALSDMCETLLQSFHDAWIVCPTILQCCLHPPRVSWEAATSPCNRIDISTVSPDEWEGAPGFSLGS